MIKVALALVLLPRHALHKLQNLAGAPPAAVLRVRLGVSADRQNFKGDLVYAMDCPR